MKGAEIPPPADESLRLFALCQAFSFKHLPSPGAILDQNPVLLERFLYILGEQRRHEKKEEDEKKRKQGGPRPQIKGVSRAAH